ncbi:MAG: hypothetical protein WKG07_28240 [Hymenobacter sp.]
MVHTSQQAGGTRTELGVGSGSYLVRVQGTGVSQVLRVVRK